MSLSGTPFCVNDQTQLFSLLKLEPRISGLYPNSGQGLPSLSKGYDLVSGPFRGLEKWLCSSYAVRYALFGSKILVISLKFQTDKQQFYERIAAGNQLHHELTTLSTTQTNRSLLEINAMVSRKYFQVHQFSIISYHLCYIMYAIAFPRLVCISQSDNSIVIYA